LSGKLGVGAVTTPTETLHVTGSALIGGASDNITISSTGVVTLNGAAKITHHEQLAVTTSSGAIFSTYATVVGGVQLNANTDYLYTSFELFNSWDGTNNIIEIDWTPQTDITTGQTVIFVLTYKAVAENEDADTGTAKTITTTYTSSGTTSAGKMIHTPVTLAYNDATQPLSANDHVYIRCNRDATTDTYAGNVLVTAFERIWIANKHGTVH
jgi:hypothetical protein